MAVGLAETDKIFYSAASGVGMPIVYLGSKTGRDGIHGATMASAEFGADAEEKRPTVQVGDPFSEKLLLEACLEIMAKGCVIAIQDMGAAGLTCSAVEMGAKGDLGVTLDLDKVPCRETGMSAYEMMLSESQERMLMVLKPEKEKEAEAIFRKWGLDFAVVGETTPTKRFIVTHGGAVMADLPIKELGDEAPVYDRPFVEAPKLPVIDAASIKPPMPIADALEKLIGSPDLCSQALGVGAIRPRHPRQHGAAAGRRCRGGAHQRRPEGAGADLRRDAALLRGRSVRRRQAGGGRSLAQSHRGRRARRSRSPTISISAIRSGPRSWASSSAASAASARPARRSISRSCPAMSRSTTRPTARRSCRRRRSAASGCIDDFTKSMTLAFKADGEAILLIGETRGWLGQSLYLRDICGREEGAPPPVDLAAEKRNGDFVRGLIRDGLATAVHDVSDGGLLVALAEMAMASGIGAVLGSAAGRSRRMPSGSARIRRAMWSRRRTPMPSRNGRRPPACRLPGSARPAAACWRSPASGRCRSTISNGASRAGCRPIWPARNRGPGPYLWAARASAA